MESYTDPVDVYMAAKARGMDVVTITDHNTLAGSLAIAHLPDTFLSCEFDTWFPEDGVKVHVVALGLDEDTFAQANLARRSVYEVTAFLREAGVAHFLAHPLFDMSGVLTPDHVERLLLLFNVLEGINGSRTQRCNGLLRQIVASLTAETIADMAERQGIEPYGPEPWKKGLTGGSDDHSGLFTAGAHTVAGGDGTTAGFLRAVAAGDCAPAGEDGDARLLAHSIYAASFWRIREILRLDATPAKRRAMPLLRRGFGRIGRDEPLLDKAVHGVRTIVPALYTDGDPRGPAWEGLLEREIGELRERPKGIHEIGSRDLNRRLFEVGRRLADDVLAVHMPGMARGEGRTIKQRLQASFAVGMVHFLQLPYFIAWNVQGRDRALQHELRAYFLADSSPSPSRLAVFAEWGPEEPPILLNGSLRQAAAARGVRLSLITASATGTTIGRESAEFAALAWRQPRLNGRPKQPVPSAAAVIDHLDQEAFTAVHLGSFGPLGTVGLIGAKLLHLPVTGSCVSGASPPGAAGGMAPPYEGKAGRRALRMYRMLDEVIVRTYAEACALHAGGVDVERLRVLPDPAADPDAAGGYVQAVLDGATLLPPRPILRQATDLTSVACQLWRRWRTG
jgi:hypothetical protein